MQHLPKIIHVDLRSLDADYVDLRYSAENLNDFEPRRLQLAEIQDLIEMMERDYYVSLPEDYATTGRQLYEWLDGRDRFLTNLLGSRSAVLVIALSERLAHLPWEMMHDGTGFLVARSQPVIPVRWQAQGSEQITWSGSAAANRPLQMLFMATSPAGVEPVLDFEAEEGRILTATDRQPLALTVEESGCLTELADLLTSYDADHFDVVHLSGHALIGEAGPRFVMETETGDRADASAKEIAEAFRFSFPPLLFLSGCHTGQAGRENKGSGEVPSMAAALLAAGAGAVLGWGRPVRDVDGILAAETLYAELSGARRLPEALAFTYQAMIKAKARDWHLLRLYVSGAMPQNLVTPKHTKGRQRPAKPSMVTAFLDVEGKVKVPDRKSFVGRRRPLQACLRALRDPEMTGVLLYGMGGLGKSSLAARLCDRLPTFEPVVLSGPLDEAELVKRLSDSIRNPDLRQRLQDPNEGLKYRLRDLFEAINLAFLLVLDDFDANLEPGLVGAASGFRLGGEAARVLGALMWAIEAADRGHRMVMTCRYDFEFGGLGRVHKQPLARLQQADLDKKCRQLEAFGKKSVIERSLRERALRLADGNPRLLEWLDKVLRNSMELGQGNAAAVLDRLAEEPAELREQVLAEVLVQQMDAPMREMLSRALWYELPVPKEAVLALGEEGSGVLIGRAVALGLLEQSVDGALRVPRVLPLEMVEDEALAAQAAQVLYRLWWEEAESFTEAQGLEIHRLAMTGKDDNIAGILAGKLGGTWKNKSRFREAAQLCRTTLTISQNFLVFHQLACSEESLGEIEQAATNYQKALDLCPTKEEKERAAMIHNLANLKADQGDVKDAITLYQESLAIKEQIGNVQGKAATLHELARLKANQGDVEDAIKLYQESLDITEQIGDVKTKADTLHNLAGLKANQGDVEGVIALYQESLAIEEQIGNVQGKAATLAMMGQLLVGEKGDLATAIPYLQESLAILQRIGSPDARTVQDMINRISGES